MATQTATTTGNDTFLADWQDWHRQQEARLADPHGFLAVTGLHWLTATPQRFSDAPGSWSTGTDGVTVVLDEDEELVIGGTVRRGTYRFGVIAEGSLRIWSAPPSRSWIGCALIRSSPGPRSCGWNYRTNSIAATTSRYCTTPSSA
ncbi:hypothetical protein NLM24_22540 [Nocardia zapadnayensis]|uniref:hypothetical protein n=1 Tax=Nocardia rhamnosiphila TaxID=426716 RepID=UPI002247897E|nr:hypothetical protein [Nocardia zapadnayensis]MCX0273419.1 hypothetical protein [Nocardia zapadnayensis]